MFEYGFAYGLAWMGSFFEGLGGYYVLCWICDVLNFKIFFVCIFWIGDNVFVMYVWDLNVMGVIFKSSYVFVA